MAGLIWRLQWCCRLHVDQYVLSTVVWVSGLLMNYSKLHLCAGAAASSKKRSKEAKEESASKKKRKKKKKKAKKETSLLSSEDKLRAHECTVLFVDGYVLLISGSGSSDSKSASTSNEPEEAQMEDSACVLGLQKKDHPRPLNATTLDNLQTKQLAYALSGVTERLSASDILEAGGELASCLGLGCAMRHSIGDACNSF